MIIQTVCGAALTSTSCFHFHFKAPLYFTLWGFLKLFANKVHIHRWEQTAQIQQAYVPNVHTHISIGPIETDMIVTRSNTWIILKLKHLLQVGFKLVC